MSRTQLPIGWLQVAIVAIAGLLLLGDGSPIAMAEDCGPRVSERACCATPKIEHCCCLNPSMPAPVRSDVAVAIVPAAARPAMEPAAMGCPCRLSAPTDPAQQSDRPVRDGSNPSDSEAASDPTLDLLSPSRIPSTFDGPQPSARPPGLPLYLRLAHLRF